MLIQMNINKEDVDSVLTLCNSLQFATIRLSLDMHILHVNHIIELLFLHPSYELINKSIHDVCSNLGIEIPISPTVTSEILGESSISTIHKLANNKLADVHWNISHCVKDERILEYILIGKVMMMSDVNQSTLQIKTIIDSLPIAVFSKDMDGSYITVNEYQAKIAGFKNEKNMLGKGDYDASWFNDAAVVREGDELAIRKKGPIMLEEHLVLDDGNRAILLVNKAPLLNDKGGLIGVIGTSVDVTEQRKSSALNPKPPFVSIEQDSSKMYLSKKEIECVNWMIKGKSSSEMAIILGISKRTIETHMNSIKRKLNCYKQFQVGYLIGKYGHLLL